MSILPKETIEVIAQSVGINNLSVDAALTLAPDVEYRMRELMQEAIKCMRHSRRTILTTDDVDTALNIRNVEPVYGFASGDPLRFKRAVGHMDLFYIEDKDVDFKDIIEAPLPKAPLDTSIMCHWLAIEGVQPAIPENAPVQVIVRPDEKRPERKDDGLPIDIKVPVQHVLSRELQLYFDKITELTIRGSETVLFKEALISLANDAGLHPLVPYFTCFIADEVARGLGDFCLLFALMRLVRSLLKNPHIQIEPYLHQLMPSVVSCLVAKRLGNRLADNHWELRDFTAKLVASICKRFGHAYGNLQPRLTRTLVNAFLDPKRAITQHYGAIQGLAALGPNVVRTLILPNLKPYLQLLEPEMLLESQRNEMKRHEAWRVYGALLHAAGQCIYDRLKKFPVLPSPPCHEVWRKKEKINTLPPGKRKACMERSEVEQKASMEHSEDQRANMEHSEEEQKASMDCSEEDQKASMERSEEEQKASMDCSEEDQKASMERSEEEQKASMERSEEQKASMDCSEEEQKASMECSEEEQKASMDCSEEEQKASMECSEEEQKASMDCSEEEPPLKRVAINGPLLENNSSPSVKQNEVDAIASSSGASDLPSTSEPMAPATRKESGRDDSKKKDKEVLKLSAVMNQVWKDDLNSGQVLVSMLELFGESIFPFIPAPEMSLFL